MIKRMGKLSRETRETKITCELCIDGSGEAEIQTGIGFLDHLYVGLTRHAHFDLKLRCEGDLHIDDHHTAEDTAIVLGSVFRQAIGDKRGIARFGYAYAPLDEALARAVVDISGRSFAAADLGLQRESIGTLSTENVRHVLQSFAIEAQLTLHVDLLKGENDHHRAEAAFKATALSLKQAVSRSTTGRLADAIPSTKGTL